LDILSVASVFRAIKESESLLIDMHIPELNRWIYNQIFGNEFFAERFEQLARLCMGWRSKGRCTCTGCLSAFSAVVPIRMAEPDWLFAAESTKTKGEWEDSWKKAVTTLHGATMLDSPLAHEGLWLGDNSSKADRLLQNLVELNEPNPNR